MAQAKKSKKVKDEWNTLGLCVTDYNVAMDWGFNSAIHDRRRRSDESPVYQSNQYLYLDCVVIWPEEQEGDVYHISLSEGIKDWFLGPPTDYSVKLGHFAVRDKQGNRKYRKYKGKEIEIYDPPFEIGMIEKSGGEYHAWANVEGEILSQMINLVLSANTKYVHLSEVIRPKPTGRRGKNRWVTRVSVHLGEDDEREIEIPRKPKN